MCVCVHASTYSHKKNQGSLILLYSASLLQWCYMNQYFIDMLGCCICIYIYTSNEKGSKRLVLYILFTTYMVHSPITPPSSYSSSLYVCIYRLYMGRECMSMCVCLCLVSIEKGLYGHTCLIGEKEGSEAFCQKLRPKRKIRRKRKRKTRTPELGRKGSI